MSDETKKILVDVSIETTEAIKAVVATKTEIVELKKAQKELDLTTDDGKAAYEAYAAQIRQLSNAARQQQKEIDNSIKAQKAEMGSMDQLKATLSNLTAEYNRLSEEQRNSAEGLELKDQIKGISDALKGTEGGLGNFSRTVGEYENKIISALGLNKGFAGSLVSMTENSESATGGFKKMGDSAKAFGKSLLSLLANPVVLMIAAITAGVMLLVTVFKKTVDTIKNNEEQSNRLTAALAPLKVIGDAVTRVFEKLGETLISAAEGFGKVVGWMADLVGASKEVNQSTQDYINLEKEKQKLIQDTRQLNVDASKAEVEIAELRNRIAQKDKFTAEERVKFVDKAINMEMKLSEDRRILAERNLAVLKEEGKRTKNNAEFEEKLASARIAVNNATRDALNKTKELASQRVEALNSIKAEEKAEEDRKKAAYEKRLTAIEKARDAEIKADTATLALKVANQGKLDELRLLDENYLQQRLNYLEENAAGEKAIVEKQLQYKKISAQEAALKLVEIEQNKNEQLKNLESKKLDLVIANLEYEAEFAALKLEEELAGKIRTDEEMHLSELLRIERDKEAKIKELELRLTTEPEKEEEIKKQIALVSQRARTAIAKQDADFAAKQNELKLSAQKTNLANELELARGNINKEHFLKLQQLEAERLAEIEAAEKTGADVALINKKYAQFEQDLAEETRKKKIANIEQYATAVADAFSALNELLYALGEREIQDAEEKNNIKKQNLDKELKAGLISQQEHDYQVALSAYELDKKKDKIEREAAIREKALKAAQAVINTASAIVAMLALGPAGIPLSIAAGITGALQLAAILATPIPSSTAGTIPKFEDFAPGEAGGTDSSGKSESQRSLDKAAEDAQKQAERAQSDYEKAVEKAEKALQDAKDLAAKIAQEEKDRADKAIMDAWEKSDRAIAEASKRADEISARAQQTLSTALSNLEKAQQTVLDIQAKIDKKAADKLAAEEDARIKALEEAEQLIFDAEQEANKQAENAQRAADKAIEVAQQKELAYLELLRQSQEAGQTAEDLQRAADAAKANYTSQASMLWYQPELKAALRKQAEDAQRAADKAKEDEAKQAEKLEKARIDAENARLAAEQAIKVAEDAKAAQSSASEAAKQAALAAEERARLATEAAQRASDEEDAAWQRELEAAKQAEIEAELAAELAKLEAEQAKIDAEIAAQKKLEAELAAEARRAAYDAEQEDKRRKANEEAQAKADKTAQEAQQAANDAAKAAALANEAAALAAAAAGWSAAEKVNPTSTGDTNGPVVTPRGDYNFNSSGYTFKNDGGYQNRSTQENTLTKRDMQEAMADAVSEIKVYATIEDIRKEDKNYLQIESRATY